MSNTGETRPEPALRFIIEDVKLFPHESVAFTASDLVSDPKDADGSRPVPVRPPDGPLRRAGPIFIFLSMMFFRHIWIFWVICHVAAFESSNFEANLIYVQLTKQAAFVSKRLRGNLSLRGGATMPQPLPDPVRRNVNGRNLASWELSREMFIKSHDLICEVGWFGEAKWRTAVPSFDALDGNKKYITVRYPEHAYRLHLHNMQNAVVNLTPLATGLTLFGIGMTIFGMGMALFGLAAFLTLRRN